MRAKGPTKRQATDLLDAASRGATNREACKIVGIAESTLYNWLNDSDLGVFGDAYTRMRAEGRMRSIEVIANSVDWRAHAWLLERVDPTHWGKRNR